MWLEPFLMAGGWALTIAAVITGELALAAGAVAHFGTALHLQNTRRP